MILYPAIDIRDGHVVRLLRGHYGSETAYDDDPVDAAQRWLGQGARALHVVDLDGARAGEPRNLEHVQRVGDVADVPIQFGGGVRDAGAVSAAFEAGADRVVLGTAALAQPDLVASLASEYGVRIAVGVDARRGRVAIEGWRRETPADPGATVRELAVRGVRMFVFTPVEVDGTLAGPAIESVRELASEATGANARLIYSGGVGSLEDLRRLRDLGLECLDGVIVGRALYDGRFTVAEGQSELDG